MQSRDLVNKVVEYAFNKKATDIKVLDLRQVTSITDYFVICTGESTPQVKAICDEIEEGLENDSVRAWHREGYSHLHWVLLDYVDVVVHVFLPEERDFYSLERLWGAGEIVEIEEINERTFQKSSN
ncbi:ribosome silencing factor [candidate division KSB1 bacterium]|nr:ribosome silencing factor [candidate division KSB1 bacterium]